jgi:hypothetical protein
VLCKPSIRNPPAAGRRFVSKVNGPAAGRRIVGRPAAAGRFIARRLGARSLWHTVS